MSDAKARDEPDRFLRIDEVKRRVGLGKTMIYRLIGRQEFPPPYKISPFASRWSDQEIREWINRYKDGVEGVKKSVS